MAAVIAILVVSRASQQTNELTLQQQVTSIASQLHAPGDFNTMTAATSSLTAAQHMRYQIQQDLLQGMGRQAIMSQMVEEYGPGVLAAPYAAGWGLMLWVAPVVVLLLFAFGLATVLRRLKTIRTWTSPNAAADSKPHGTQDAEPEMVKARLKEYL